MKRVALILLALILLGGLAQALPGPEPGSPGFDIVVEVEDGADIGTARDRVDIVSFDPALGWDFGDREAYRCAVIEYFSLDDGAELFRVEIERMQVPGQGDNYARLNDRGGRETGDGGVPHVPDWCGRAAGTGPATLANHDADGAIGDDHFPHHTHFHFYRDAVEILPPGTDPAQGLLPLHRDDCALGYWTPGDQAGEAWLWWDEDGPTNDGHGDLPCNGGADEPVAVARAFVTNMADDVGVCVHDDLDGSRCKGPIPEPDPTPTPTPTPSPSPSESPSPSPSPSPGPDCEVLFQAELLDGREVILTVCDL